MFFISYVRVPFLKGFTKQLFSHYQSYGYEVYDTNTYTYTYIYIYIYVYIHSNIRIRAFASAARSSLVQLQSDWLVRHRLTALRLTRAPTGSVRTDRLVWLQIDWLVRTSLDALTRSDWLVRTSSFDCSTTALRLWLVRTKYVRSHTPRVFWHAAPR